MHPGRIDGGFGREVVGEALDVGGLVHVVELREDRLLEDAGDGREVEPAHGPRRQVHDAPRVCCLPRHNGGDLRVLDLDGNTPAVLADSSVDLGQ